MWLKCTPSPSPRWKRPPMHKHLHDPNTYIVTGVLLYTALACLAVWMVAK